MTLGGGGGVKQPPQQPAHPQYANYWAPLTRKRHIPPHPAQPRHTNYWAPRTRKRHQREHRPQRPTERSNPTQHAKGRTGDCPGPRKETTTRRNVTQGVGGVCAEGGCVRTSGGPDCAAKGRAQGLRARRSTGSRWWRRKAPSPRPRDLQNALRAAAVQPFDISPARCTAAASGPSRGSVGWTPPPRQEWVGRPDTSRRSPPPPVLFQCVMQPRDC